MQRVRVLCADDDALSVLYAGESVQRAEVCVCAVLNEKTALITKGAGTYQPQVW